MREKVIIGQKIRKTKWGLEQCVDYGDSPAALAVLVISLLVLVVESLPHPVELEKNKYQTEENFEN